MIYQFKLKSIKLIMYKKHLLCIVFSLLLLVGCKDQIQTVQFSTAIQDGNEITIKWMPSNISGFKYYRIMRASDGQHFSTINDADSVGSDAYNRNTTSYTDSSFPYVDSVYYKIMAFGDEIISSPNILVHIKKPLEISQNIQNAFIMSDENKMLIFGSNGSNSSMYLYDYTNNTLINNTPVNVTTSGSAIFFGKYKGKYEFYFFDSWNDKLNIYDGLTLNQVANMSFWSGYPKFATNNNGTLYSTSGSNYITLIHRNSLVTTTYQGNNYIDQLYYRDIDNTLLGLYYNKIVLYTLDNTGNIIAENFKTLNYSTNPIYIENSNLVYGGNYGSRKIINTDNLQENTLTISNNGYKEFTTLYSVNNVIYACSNYENKLYCFSMTDFKLIKTITIRFTPTKFLSDPEYLFYYGSSNGINIIDKIKLVQ